MELGSIEAPGNSPTRDFGSTEAPGSLPLPARRSRALDDVRTVGDLHPPVARSGGQRSREDSPKSLSFVIGPSEKETTPTRSRLRSTRSHASGGRPRLSRMTRAMTRMVVATRWSSPASHRRTDTHADRRPQPSTKLNGAAALLVAPSGSWVHAPLPARPSSPRSRALRRHRVSPAHRSRRTREHVARPMTPRAQRLRRLHRNRSSGGHVLEKRHDVVERCGARAPRSRKCSRRHCGVRSVRRRRRVPRRPSPNWQKSRARARPDLRLRAGVRGRPSPSRRSGRSLLARRELMQAQKPFDLTVFPSDRHGYGSPQARQYVSMRVIEYFAEHL